MPSLLSIHAGKAEPLRGTDRWSAIRKLAIEGTASVGPFGLEGDVQHDRRYHGGEFKALCAYPTAYYSHWKDTLGLTMPVGSFGENLAIEGILDDDVCLGDVYTIGGAVTTRVTGPRAPCGNLDAHWGRRDFRLAVREQKRTGWYLSVLTPGAISAGLPFRLTARPHAGWTLPRFWDVIDSPAPGASDLDEILAIDGLDPTWRKKASKKRDALCQPGT